MVIKNVLGALLAAALWWPLAAFGQSTAAQVQDGFLTTSGCPSGASVCWKPYSVADPLQVAGTFSATLGGFAPATVGTPISVTTGGDTGTLPVGAVVVATNVGTTNGAYCALGAASTTAQQYIAPNGGWFAFTVGAATQLTCITSTSTTTVNMVGGAGLATGTGGGGGGGSGGSVTQGTSPWVDNITQIGGATLALGQTTMSASIPVALASNQSALAVTVSGVATAANQTSQITQETAINTVLGAQADAVCGTATGTCSVEALLKFLNTSVSGSIPAGTAVIGKVSIDQTTPGTTNLVALTANQSVNLAQVAGTNTVNGGLAGSQSVGGTVATNVAITDNPVNTGGQAVSSENAAVTTARKVQFVADLVGKQIVLPYANPENFVSGVTAAMTATTSTSLIAAPASGLRNYVTQCTFSNSHATVGTMMNLQDGSGGTTIYSAPAAPAYGGATITFPTPLRQPTTATALFVVNATTGANTFAACSGYKGA